MNTQYNANNNVVLNRIDYSGSLALKNTKYRYKIKIQNTCILLHELGKDLVRIIKKIYIYT